MQIIGPHRNERDSANPKLKREKKHKPEPEKEEKVRGKRI